MLELKLTQSCEIYDLICVIAERLGKTFDECESRAFEENCYPESRKVYMDLRWPEDKENWFRAAVQDLMKSMHVDRLYITEAI